MLGKTARIIAATTCFFACTAALVCCVKREDNDPKGSGCYTETYIPVDSVHITPSVALNDSFAVEFFGTGANYCYGNFNAKVTQTGNTSMLFRATADYNHCIGCAQTTKLLRKTLKFKATQTGTWRLVFEDNMGNFYVEVVVN